ncbi:hypothetical protein K461DRAFT_233067 [Myriangium duriaei CBS 260.36]|uniref:Uncharacterized protein n=1 Tax=Myriangium duriaei CBS 260.36 TaxID=1168546 RepID=A0A9P4IR34_9PEZI|nr:hypothetical protein K461DRAFT_233067 [Myriangium duriaei CBS 260.36]
MPKLNLSLWLGILLSSSPSSQQQQPVNDPALHITNPAGRAALLWTSIGVAVVTSLLQGMITTVVQISEDQDLWTFRFRIARFEHWWWTNVSTLLSISFALIIITFLAGNNQDALGVLALSTATTIAIVRYAVPAWRNRIYIENRWRAWTGPSRTSIRGVYRDLCGDSAQWIRLYNAHPEKRVLTAPSDDWGLAVRPPRGLSHDPTAILDKFSEDMSGLTYTRLDARVYDDGTGDDANVSLLWGEQEGFRRRVSRAVLAMPKGLLHSRPITVDGYNGEGLCLAFGIFGRNKGLRPHTLMFDVDDKWKTQRGIIRNRPETTVRAILENSSSWAPRPSKVMRSYYAHAVEEQYGGLPPPFMAAVTEVALIMLDIRQRPLRMWLDGNMEQQSMDVNHWLTGRSGRSPARATPPQLYALYRASYVSMIISRNYMPPSGVITEGLYAARRIVRPDLTCFALLYLAEHAVVRDVTTGQWIQGPGIARPEWWDNVWVESRLHQEHESMKAGWREPAAWLLGLKEFPPELEYIRFPQWPHITYLPEN